MQRSLRRCAQLLEAAADACAHAGGGGGGGSVAGAVQREALQLRPSAAAGCSSAGPWRGYASAAEPAEAPQEAPQRAAAGASAPRVKPRFLLERLAQQQQQKEQPRGGGVQRGGSGAARGPWAPGSGQAARRQPGAQQPPGGGHPARERQPRPHNSRPAQPAGAHRQEGQRPAQARQPWQRGAEARPPHPNSQHARPPGGAHTPPSHGRPRGQAGEGAVRPPYRGPAPQTSFPSALPTAFPTAFPRAGGGAGGGASARQLSKAEERARRERERAAQEAARAAAAAPEEVSIPEDVTVLKLAQLLGVGAPRLEEILQELGEGCTSRQDLVPPDAAELAALELGKVAVLARRGGRGAAPDADAQPRPAVVTVMGHVDHGKTTLLDALRKTAVAAGEAGGITQHIGAFEVCMPGSQASLTFLDTPGHAAFSAMRARGAAVTDLAVLVVAADDGVMPQTREAISHARAAGCPIVVAITKCDAPNAQPARVRQQLVAAGLETEEVGGSVQVVEVSAVAGLGLDDLEEALLLQAELMELGASRSRRAEGVVIEARVDRGQGPVATVVVKRGTLRVGQPAVVGTEWGRIRSLRGTGGQAVAEVLPGQPAEIAGLKGVPQAGDQLLVVDSEERAQTISRARTANADMHRRASLARMVAEQRPAGGVEGEGEGEPGQRTLPVIIKADVQGSAEAVRDAVAHMSTEHVRVQVVHVGVGPVSQSDVQLAVPLGAKILAFNVRTSAPDVDALAKQRGVEVRCQRVIYGLLEDVGALLVGASPKVEREVVAGAAEVLQVFQLKGSRGKEAGVVAGCRVSEGAIKASLKYRVLRGGEVVHEGRCASLKRHKLEVETVGKGTECGVLLDGFDEVRPGDQLQCVAVEMVADVEVNTGPENKW